MNPTLLEDAISGKNMYIDWAIECNETTKLLEQRVHSSGDTILHLVSARGHSDAVRAILTKVPRLLWNVNSEGNTALHVAARAGHNTVVSALLFFAEKSGDENNLFWLRNGKGNTALHEAATYNRGDAVQALLNENQKGICYSYNKQRETPLYLAANRGFHSLVDLIVDSIGPPRSSNYDGPNGRTPLHAAVISNSKGCITTLLGWDSNLVHYKDYNDQTPLHYAASSGFGNLVCQLVSKDPSIAYVGNAEGKNMLHLAIQNNRKHAINYILRNERCKWLIDNLITKTDDHGNTPLHLLATSECFVKGIIDHPMIDHRAVNNDGLTPLDLYYKNSRKSSVATYDQVEIAKMLKRAGSTWDIQTPSDSLPYSRDEIRSMAETQMIVSALIATVAFTAGFAMPGGYISDGSPYEGMAVHVRGNTLAFRAFVMFDFLAMLCSTSSLCMYFLITVKSKRMTEDTLNFLANEGIGLNVVGLGAITLAFCAELIVVLHHSHFPTMESSPDLSSVIFTFIAVLVCIRYVQKGGYHFFDIFQPKKWRIVRRSVTFVKYLSRRRKNV